MDRERLFEKLDIESPEDFKYYENVESLLEEDEHIEEELITELISECDANDLSDHLNNFFDSFTNNIPDEENELCIIIDSFKSNIMNCISEDMGHDEVHDLVSELYKFRRWYVLDHNAVDRLKGEEISVRDARYELLSAKFLDEKADIDFGRALTGGPDSYQVRIKDII